MVAPLVGAWIESFKYSISDKGQWVAPLVGAWIESITTLLIKVLLLVAPLVGAWIERQNCKSLFLPT